MKKRHGRRSAVPLLYQTRKSPLYAVRLDLMNLAVQVGALIQASRFRAEAAYNFHLKILGSPSIRCWLKYIKPSRTRQGFQYSVLSHILYHISPHFASSACVAHCIESPASTTGVVDWPRSFSRGFEDATGKVDHGLSTCAMISANSSYRSSSVRRCALALALSSARSSPCPIARFSS